MANERTHRSHSIRVILIHEKDIVRIGLRTILERTQEFRIVGEARTLDEFTPWASMLGFDIVIWGVSIKSAAFLTTYPEISDQFPTARVMVLACSSDEQTLHVLSQFPKINWLLNDVKAEELSVRLRQLFLNVDFIDSKLPTSLIQKGRLCSDSERRGKYLALSQREREVAILIVKGKTNREISKTMGVTEKTIKNYVSNIFNKLNVTRRTQIAAIFATEEATTYQKLLGG